MEKCFELLFLWKKNRYSYYTNVKRENYDTNDMDFKFNILNMLKIQKPQETEEEKDMTETKNSIFLFRVRNAVI